MNDDNTLEGLRKILFEHKDTIRELKKSDIDAFIEDLVKNTKKEKAASTE